MCAACRLLLALIIFCLNVIAFTFTCAAAKSIYDRLGIDQDETEESADAPQLVVQPIAQPTLSVVTALPFNGNLRADALLPVVVQPRLISEEAYTAPCAERALNH